MNENAYIIKIRWEFHLFVNGILLTCGLRLHPKEDYYHNEFGKKIFFFLNVHGMDGVNFNQAFVRSLFFSSYLLVKIWLKKKLSLV